MGQVIERPDITRTLRTGYPNWNNVVTLPIDKRLCDCGCVAKMKIKNNFYCLSCADDEWEVVLL